MELDFFWLGIGIAFFGYFIGSGLKNFKSPDPPGMSAFYDLEEEHKMVKESDLHWFIGITKEDATHLVEEYPDVPHIVLNGNRYYPKEKLKKWLLDIESRQD